MEIEGFKSSNENIVIGVPQRSILGPLLFIIFINDIHICTSNSDTILHADDSTFYAPLSRLGSTLEEVNSNINLELNRIDIWLRSNKLKLNTSKTKFMIFGRSFSSSTLEIKVSEHRIDEVSEFLFLGSFLDRRLNWKSHINNLTIKHSKTLGIMKKLSGILPINILKTIYSFSKSFKLSNFTMGL